MLFQCAECGTPVEMMDDGTIQCPACLMTYAGAEMGNDTILEEGLMLSDALDPTPAPRRANPGESG